MTAGIHSSTPECKRSVDKKHMDGWTAPIFTWSQKYNWVLEILQDCRHSKRVPDADSSLPTVRRMAAKCSGWAQVLNPCCTHHFTKPGNIAVITKFQEIAAVFMLTILLHEHVNTVLRTAVIFLLQSIMASMETRIKNLSMQGKKKPSIFSPLFPATCKTSWIKLPAKILQSFERHKTEAGRYWHYSGRGIGTFVTSQVANYPEEWKSNSDGWTFLISAALINIAETH